VGTLIALTNLLTLEDPHRFRKEPRRVLLCGTATGSAQLGQSKPQLHISKQGDRYLPTLLVEGAHGWQDDGMTDSWIRQSLRKFGITRYN